MNLRGKTTVFAEGLDNQNNSMQIFRYAKRASGYFTKPVHILVRILCDSAENHYLFFQQRI